MELVHERMETVFQSIVGRDDAQKSIDDHVPNSLLDGGVGTGMLASTNELVHRDRCRREKAGELGFLGKDEAELDSGVVAMLGVEIVRHCSIARLVVAGIAAMRGFLGRRAHFPLSAEDSALLEATTCWNLMQRARETSQTPTTRFAVGDNGGISDSKQQGLQNSEATVSNSVEIKIVRTVSKTSSSKSLANGHCHQDASTASMLSSATNATSHHVSRSVADRVPTAL